MSEALDGTKKLALMIGMCARARKIVIGCDGVCLALPEKKPAKRVHLVLEASDVSDNTHKKLSDKCLYYKVRKEIIPLSQEELAHAIGKKGSQEEDGEQEKEGKGGTWKFLLITFERPRVNRIWSPGKA